MAPADLRVHVFLAVVLAASAAIPLAGCRTIDFYDTPEREPVPPMLEPPRELAMVSLPAYRIEPPDMLQIEMLKQVPLPPYRAEAYDVLRIDVAGALPEQPINDYFLVEGEGTVTLGPTYGSVRVVGMTIEEINKAIDRHLRQFLTQPEVSVQLARAYGTQPVTNEYIVTPDGTVNLRRYGAVRVAGMTVAEAKVALEKHLAQFFDSPEVSVSVLAYNSKYYYVVVAGGGMGDSIVKFPFTGNETVLDAISQVGGLTQLSSKDIWIARPAPSEFGHDQILPVEWDAIAQGGATSTNYQIMPDDRVYIAEDRTLALTNFINKLINPVESVTGTLSLGTQTIRGTQTLGRDYNRNRR
jgi:polysaccharide export outer membrane protein